LNLAVACLTQHAPRLQAGYKRYNLEFLRDDAIRGGKNSHYGVKSLATGKRQYKISQL
jgi:hypothetical protein